MCKQDYSQKALILHAHKNARARTLSLSLSLSENLQSLWVQNNFLLANNFEAQ
jgi:hypothetical protein